MFRIIVELWIPGWVRDLSTKAGGYVLKSCIGLLMNSGQLSKLIASYPGGWVLSLDLKLNIH